MKSLFFFYNQKLDLDLLHVKMRFFFILCNLISKLFFVIENTFLLHFLFLINFKNMQYAAKDIPENIFIHFYTLAEPNFIFFSMCYGPVSGIRRI